MTREEIQKVMDEVGNLTDHGLGIFDNGRGLNAEQRREQLAKDRAALLDSGEACAKVCRWLEEQPIERLRTINDRRTSYGLKHVAEKDVGYITNGVFIAAAIHCGFKWKAEPGSPNPCFNMSEKSIKAIEKRQGVRRI